MPATAEQKTAIIRAFIQQVFIADSQRADVDTADLAAAAEAAYNWAETNQLSFNAALPVPFKTVATAGQKAYLLNCAVRELVGTL